MPAVLRYGIDSTLRLELPANTVVASCRSDATPGEFDVRSVVAEALAQPIDFPSLARATTPDDHVTIVLAEGVPQAARIVAGLVGELLECGVAPDHITILRLPDDATTELDDPRRDLSPDNAARVILETHDPHDRTQLAYLAASEGGRAIYLNRTVCEADVVIPVGCLRCSETTGYHGVNGGIYPACSDAKTIRRFNGSWAAERSEAGGTSLQQEVDEVAWLLGACFTVQLVPGPGEEILHVLAGRIDSVSRQGQPLCDAAWRVDVPRRTELVVATMSGPSTQQTWRNVGRALDAARRAVTDGGVIALCCDLDALPPPAVSAIAGFEDYRLAIHALRSEGSSDALPAAQVARALDHARVFLLSRLDESIVEDLDMAFVAEPEEIVRLASRHDPCLLLADAQHLIATPTDDPY